PATNPLRAGQPALALALQAVLLSLPLLMFPLSPLSSPRQDVVRPFASGADAVPPNPIQPDRGHLRFLAQAAQFPRALVLLPRPRYYAILLRRSIHRAFPFRVLPIRSANARSRSMRLHQETPHLLTLAIPSAFVRRRFAFLFVVQRWLPTARRML